MINYKKLLLVFAILCICIIPVFGADLTKGETTITKEPIVIAKETPIVLTKNLDIQMVAEKPNLSVVNIKAEDGSMNWNYDNIYQLWTPHVEYTITEKAQAISTSVTSEKITTQLSENTKVDYQVYSTKVKETITITKPAKRIWYTYDIHSLDKYQDYTYYFPNSTEQKMLNEGKEVLFFTHDNGSEERKTIVSYAKDNPTTIKIVSDPTYISFNGEPAQGGLTVNKEGFTQIFYTKPTAIDATGKIYEMSFVLNEKAKTLDVVGDLSGATYPVEIDPSGLTVTTDTTTVEGSTIVRWIYSADPGNATWTVPAGVTSIWYLVVGGGGSGGTVQYGGGGGGGYASNGTQSVTPSTEYTITVGHGGSGGKFGTAATSSSISSIITNANAGGSGGNYQQAGGASGGWGGGGGAAGSSNTTTLTGGDGLYDGGNGYFVTGGGGGGTTSNGESTSTYDTGATGGAGGNGVGSYINGSAVIFGGGGGGGAYSGSGGDSSCGGWGGHMGVNAGTPKPNSGCGGGGQGQGASTATNGANGIVIIRYTTPPPTQTINFTANQTSGLYNLPVNFTPTTSIVSPTKYNWSFGDNTWDNKTTTNTTHVYSSGGSYNVFLSISNATVEANITRNDYITVYNRTSSYWTSNVSSGVNPATIQFTANASNATAWNWSFGDGNYSNIENPSHIFNTINGTLNITLNSSNAYSSYLENKTIEIYPYAATTTWSSSVYPKGSNGFLTYNVESGYWNPTGYTYKVSIYDISANLKSEKSLTNQSGTESFYFDTTNYPIGYYFAYLSRTQILPGAEAEVLNTPAQTQIADYIIITGYVKNAENGTLINANVSITQGALFNNSIASTGYYTTSPTQFLSGTNVSYNVTLANYRQYLHSWLPATSKTYTNINVSMVPTNPIYSGASVGGIWKARPYNTPIAGVTVTCSNATWSSTNVTNAWGYYRFDDLKAGTQYSVQGTKSGYSISQVYTVTAV